jgi:hypothetical protein
MRTFLVPTLGMRGAAGISDAQENKTKAIKTKEEVIESNRSPLPRMLVG